MAIVLDGSSGATLPVPLIVSSGGTGQTTLTSLPLVSPVISGTPSGVGTLTSGTAVASTSGTSIDFTSIPSWVKRITVMFNGVSTNGTSQVQLQIGAGSIITTGYAGAGSYAVNGSSVTGISFTTGLVINIGVTGQASNTYSGHATLTLVSGNSWAMSILVCLAGIATTFVGTLMGASSITLSGALDRVRITTVNGTDTFDAGSINILYE